MDVGINSSLSASPRSPTTSVQNAGAPVIKRRAPIACRRCRRMRSKCLHDRGQPPCQACHAAGLGASDCVFPVRGQPDQDREYRHPRMRQDKNGKRDPTKTRSGSLEAPIARLLSHSTSSKNIRPADEWDLLPPLPEIIEAVNMFTRHYFQLGFIPKQAFPESLRTNHRSVSVFLVLGILSISARFMPSLVERYGSGVKAAEVFMEHASAVALDELYRGPDLARCQAFYLLSIAQQGSGLKSQSSINMAIALRMATLMRLHREETYTLINPTKELVIKAESARRTLWMLHSQDNIHSGPASPVSLVASDITALLPCNEEDFANGMEPQSRAALEDTPPAVENPRLITDQGRSLFATLIQSHYLWGTISRRAMSRDKSTRPWELNSEYGKMEIKLREWEGGLPHGCQWSNVLLKGYKAGGEDLAYLGVSMITRLCNIVLRKAYLDEIVASASGKSEPTLQPFWANMSYELFNNVRMLHEQIETQFKVRTNDDGKGVQMAAFCVYSCGFFACYLCKCPNICPDPAITREGPAMVQRCVTILTESQDLWPLASRWLDGLIKFRDQKCAAAGVEGSMADGREPIPHVLHQAPEPPATKPIQQSILTTIAPLPPHPHPPMDDQHNRQAHSPGTPMPPLLQTNPLPQTYIDPNLRLPAPQSQQEPMHPQHAHPHVHAHTQPAAPAHDHHQQGRPSTDGLGLLIEAFDTHQNHNHNHHHHHPQAAGADSLQIPVPDVAYDPPPPHHPHPHECYPVTAAAPGGPGGVPTNDGYENELQFYMSDGMPIISQGWVTGDMYGF